MGGIGSGDWTHPDRKEVVEHALEFNAVNYSALTPPPKISDSNQRLKWLHPDTNKLLGELVYRVITVKPNSKKLYFREIAIIDGRQLLLFQEIDLIKTPILTGNRKRWRVQCPLCQSKVDKLLLRFIGSDGFYCRSCSDLTYGSTQRHDKRYDNLKKHTKQMANILREALEKVNDPEIMLEIMRKIEAIK